MAFENWTSGTRNWLFTQLAWYGSIGSLSFDVLMTDKTVPFLKIQSGRNQPSALAEIHITNFGRQLDGRVKKGDPFSWNWMYKTLPTADINIFRGYVTRVKDGRLIKIEARDMMHELIKPEARRTVSFNHAKPKEILNYFLIEAGFSGKLYDPDIILPHFAADNINISDAVRILERQLTKHAGMDCSDFAHFIDGDGVFRWGPFEEYSWHEVRFPQLFREGENALSYDPAINGPGEIVALPAPEVRHSTLINVAPEEGDQVKARVESMTLTQRGSAMRQRFQFVPWGA